MKKTFFLFLFSALLMTSRAQSDKDKKPLITQSLTKDNIKNILTETSGGSISVTGVEPSEAKIEVYVSPNNSKDKDLSENEIRARMAADYELTITTNNKAKA